LPGQPHDTGCYHGPAGQLALTRRRADTRAMNATWHALTQTALTPQDSADLLTELTAR
jgi:hypothetical protein